jgi:hypothetical protein
MLDALVEHAPIRLKLRLTRAAQADTALLAFQVSPASDEACREVLELCELDLNLTLEGPRSLGEDIQNQAVTIQYPNFDERFEVPLLAR